MYYRCGEIYENSSDVTYICWQIHYYFTSLVKYIKTKEIIVNKNHYEKISTIYHFCSVCVIFIT